MFKVGDRVIGNKKANDEYGITREGWKGTVTGVSLFSDTISVIGEDGGGYNVCPRFFDLLYRESDMNCLEISNEDIEFLFN